MVRIPARSHVLYSMSNQALPWWKALAELVDNSFDANALRVIIDISGRILTVSDDGKGAADILALFTLGEHKRQSSTRLGVYGIGAKDAWLSCSDVMTVETVRNGIKTCLTVDYNHLIENDWNTQEDPVSQQTNEPSGTKIVLPLRAGRQQPSKDALNDLAFAFTPALHQGKQILVQKNGKRQALQPHLMPVREDVVTEEFEIDGKHVTIDIGILPDGVSFRGPLWLIYEHRIVERTSLGIGKQYTARRIAGSITLGKGWKLTKNKDNISEDDARLEDEISRRIEHIVKKAELLADDIESIKFRHELEEMLNGSIGGATKREKRKKGTKTGSIGPVGTGRQRRRASNVSNKPGSVMSDDGANGKRKTGFVLDFREEDSPAIGFFDSRACRVTLNLNHPFVESNRNKNHFALVVVAASLIADDQVRHDGSGRPLLRFSFDDFSTALGGIVSSIKEPDSAKV